MGLFKRATDLVYTLRFLRLLTTPFEKTKAFEHGIIDKFGNVDKNYGKIAGEPDPNKRDKQKTLKKEFFTPFIRLVFNIKKLFAKVPGLRTKVGTYAAALFLLKDTFKEHVEDPDMFEKEFMKYLKENKIELDTEISEEVIGFGEVLPKGEYVLKNDILNKEEEELTAKKGDKVIAFEDEAPVDTILGVEIFPVVHMKTQEKIYVSLEDITDG